jgi:drug/metabolite transporter (DMT)-like permease
MGFLDALSAAMQVLATFYLPGTLLVILPQVAIPVSIVASQILLKEKFTIYQYGGAVTVVFGVVVVLLPFWTHQRAPEYTCQAIAEETEEFCTLCQIEDSEEACLSHIVMNNNQEVGLDAISNSTVTYYCEWLSREDSLRQDDVLVFIWSLVMMVACIPMVLSSVYKQMALRVQLDPILVNGYVAIFQLLFGIPLSIPSGMISSPKVSPLKLPENWAEATRCLFLQANTIESGCHPDQCAEAALFVHLGLLSSAVYTISMMFVLKYGSASILYLGLTLIVPLGHLVFSIHSWTVHWSDVGGLIFLLAGLIMYRFGHDNYTEGGTIQEEDEEGEEVQVHEEGIIVLNNTNQDMVSQEGFLEFLREPFMMCGDI